MADIAILVAEEYERRMKTSRKAASGGGAEASSTTTARVAVTAALGEKLRGVDWVKKTEEAFKDLEPTSQIGVAAFRGVFSA